MSDGFNLVLLSIVLLVVVFIIFAIRSTRRKIMPSGLTGDDARRMAGQIRGRDTKCPRCGRQSSALIGTERRYKCDTCNNEFKGPEHIPAA